MKRRDFLKYAGCATVLPMITACAVHSSSGYSGMLAMPQYMIDALKEPENRLAPSIKAGFMSDEGRERYFCKIWGLNYEKT